MLTKVYLNPGTSNILVEFAIKPNLVTFFLPYCARLYVKFADFCINQRQGENKRVYIQFLLLLLSLLFTSHSSSMTTELLGIHNLIHIFLGIKLPTNIL